MIRRGIHTSEFLITLLAGLGVVAGAVAQVIPPSTAGTLGTVAAVAYVISRGIAKLNNPALSKAEGNSYIQDLKIAANALEQVLHRQAKEPAKSQAVTVDTSAAQPYNTPVSPSTPDTGQPTS